MIVHPDPPRSRHLGTTFFSYKVSDICRVGEYSLILLLICHSSAEIICNVSKTNMLRMCFYNAIPCNNPYFFGV